MSRYDFYEALAEKGYFKLERTLAGEPSEPELRKLVGGGVSNFSITVYGFERYAQAFIPAYPSIVKDVQVRICDGDQGDGQPDSASIAESLHRQPVLDRM